MPKPPPRPARGATLNAVSARFDDRQRAADGDWLDDQQLVDEGPPPLRTTVTIERPKTIITRNTSPDIAFDRSINAYRGCEHVMFSRAEGWTSKDICGQTPLYAIIDKNPKSCAYCVLTR